MRVRGTYQYGAYRALVVKPENPHLCSTAMEQGSSFDPRVLLLQACHEQNFPRSPCGLRQGNACRASVTPTQEGQRARVHDHSAAEPRESRLKAQLC